MRLLLAKTLLISMIITIQGAPNPEPGLIIQVNQQVSGGQCGNGCGCGSGPPCPKRPAKKPSANDPKSTCVNGGCCTIGGKTYESGEVFSENCMKFSCENTKWISSLEYNDICSECSANNDPHMTSYDGAHFNWHGHGTFVLSQEGCGCGSDNFVNALLDDCATGSPIATCVHGFTFQPEPSATIQVAKVDPISDSDIIVDGFSQKVDVTGEKGAMTVLKGKDGQEVPVFAWFKGCLFVMGFKAQGFLVKMCFGGTKVFAYPTMADKLCGLCGDFNNDEDDDLKYRNGTITTLTGKNGKYPAPDYGNNWEISECDSSNNTPLPAPTGDPCNATAAELDVFLQNCTAVIDEGCGTLEDLKKKFKEECVFDQCVASRSTIKDLKKKWLKERKELCEEEVMQKRDTKFDPKGPQCRTKYCAKKAICDDEDECACKPGAFANADDRNDKCNDCPLPFCDPSSAECSLHIVNTTLNFTILRTEMTWPECQTACADKGLAFPQIKQDLINLIYTLKFCIGKGKYWVGAKGTCTGTNNDCKADTTSPFQWLETDEDIPWNVNGTGPWAVDAQNMNKNFCVRMMTKKVKTGVLDGKGCGSDGYCVCGADV